MVRKGEHGPQVKVMINLWARQGAFVAPFGSHWALLSPTIVHRAQAQDNGVFYIEAPTISALCVLVDTPINQLVELIYIPDTFFSVDAKPNR